MKLLFDQNLSFRLCHLLSDIFPGSVQVARLDFAQADDRTIWESARTNGFMLVSHDSDLAEIAMLRGAPPKIIWLRCGDQPTETVAALLRKHRDRISAFEIDHTAACLEIYR